MASLAVVYCAHLLLMVCGSTGNIGHMMKAPVAVGCTAADNGDSTLYVQRMNVCLHCVFLG
jgi:hypothetical protein